MEEKTDAQWLHKAESYCASAEHCEREMRRKLMQWQCPEAFHDRIVDSLRENNYINESRFCLAFAHDKAAYNGWSRMKIRLSLRTLGLDDNDIENALQTIDETEYRQHLLRLIGKMEGDSTEKIIRSLLQRGFTYEEIKSVIDD